MQAHRSRSSLKAQCTSRPAARRPLRLLCALSLDRPGPNEARKAKPSAQTQATAQLSIVPIVDLDADVDGVRAELDDVRSAYEAGYQAGLAAARQGLEVEKARPQPDSLLRSVVKALSWRFFSTATTIILTMTFFSATLDEALEMGAAEFLSKYILFLVHERLWILVTLF